LRIALLVAGLIALAIGYEKVGGGLLAAGIIGTVIGTFVHGRRSSDDGDIRTEQTDEAKRKAS
jgi:uncharacterized membrane protein YeaQ/YmgE (transglycosylase-associated protein family)